MITVLIKLFGKVQNVSLRRIVLREANILSVLGWIKNNSDLSIVEACFQGEKEKVEKLINFLKSNPGYSKIEEIKVKEIKSSEKYDKFSIIQ